MPGFQPLQEKAYSVIQKMIEDHELRPGIIYSLTQIARDMNISRTPLKDAVVRLSQDKYIDIIPSKGFCLHEVTEEDIEDTCQVRMAIENLCAMRLAEDQESAKGRAALRQMEEYLAEMKKLSGDPEKIDDFLEFDIRFHNTLVSFAENKTLAEIYASHNYQIRTFARNSLTADNRMVNTCREHERILDAIKRKDHEGCYNAVKDHLLSTKNLSLMFLRKP